MHEIGIAESILKGVLMRAKEHKIKKISKISLRVGELKMVSNDSLQGAFDLVSQGTIAEGARLEVDFIPGDELSIQEIEVEE